MNLLTLDIYSYKALWLIISKGGLTVPGRTIMVMPPTINEMLPFRIYLVQPPHQGGRRP